VVLGDVLVEGDALLLQVVALEFADKAHVVDVLLQLLVGLLKFPERVDHNAEQDVHQDDYNDYNESLVLNESCELLGVVDAHVVYVPAPRPDAYVHVLHQPGQDVFHLVLWPPGAVSLIW